MFGHVIIWFKLALFSSSHEEQAMEKIKEKIESSFK